MSVPGTLSAMEACGCGEDQIPWMLTKFGLLGTAGLALGALVVMILAGWVLATGVWLVRRRVEGPSVPGGVEKGAADSDGAGFGDPGRGVDPGRRDDPGSGDPRPDVPGADDPWSGDPRVGDPGREDPRADAPGRGDPWRGGLGGFTWREEDS